ncbi:hypothetical protein QBC38DRAFT_550576 [Podospora fimiseda]|uniref:Uncharacterized protein n=1 Tax=Podospora fimiseda TaxID=252190 RepID=A0AAN6YMR4_9PEZI|nr:hypothetical protein QBC38DRAFT_550576 [Podospora fimiseda]
MFSTNMNIRNIDRTKISNWITSKSKPLAAAAKTAAQVTTSTTQKYAPQLTAAARTAACLAAGMTQTIVPLLIESFDSVVLGPDLRSSDSSFTRLSRTLPNPLSTLASAASSYLPASTPSVESLVKLGDDVLQAINPEPFEREKEFQKLIDDEALTRGIEHIDDVLSLHEDELCDDDDDDDGVMMSSRRVNYGVIDLDERENEEGRLYGMRYEGADELIDKLEVSFRPVKDWGRYQLAMKEMGCSGQRLELDERDEKCGG